MASEDTKTMGSVLLGFLLLLIILFILGVGMTIFNANFRRWLMPFNEETRRITYGQSLTYQQGTQNNFEDLCNQWAQTKDPDARAMLADTIQHRKQVYTGPALADDVMSCFAKIGIH